MLSIINSMKKILEILKAHKYAIIWTLCYTAIMWLVLRFLFDFDMLSIAHWRHLMRAELRGFPGFVFGILVLAALPLYIASTTLIIRTKKPLFSIPIPAFIKGIWDHMQPTLINPPQSDAEKDEEKSTTADKSESDTLPDELPSELRTAYIRARMNITPEQRSAFNQPIIQTPDLIPQVATSPAPEISEIPLPSDFDIAPTNDDDYTSPDFEQLSAPTFTEITFDTPTEPDDNPISDYLDSTGKKFEVIDDIIITDKHAIATHTDNDFWVCDDEFWFATGKQITSPIKRLTNIALERKIAPILYLGAENIMDLDTMREKWETMGIKIITTPTEIPE